MKKKKKIIAVSSIGGHWIQLLRIIKPLERDMDIIYISTNMECKTMVDDHTFYCIKDFSRWNAYLLFPNLIKAIKLIIHESPDVVISTGAAPGLICLFAAKLCGKKTIWIDSIANIQKLSMSGCVSSKFVSRTYTQWEHLTDSHILYAGDVLG